MSLSTYSSLFGNKDKAVCMHADIDNATAILVTANALLPVPSESEQQVVQSWENVLQALAACTANLLPSLHALSSMRLIPQVRNVISDAQTACKCSLSLVDVLPKPVSFCAPLVRSLEALRNILQEESIASLPRGVGAGGSSIEAVDGRSALQGLSHTFIVHSRRRAHSLSEELPPCNDAHCSKAQNEGNHGSGSLQSEGIMRYAKDVAAAVEKSRVLARSKHRQVDLIIPNSHLPSTIVKEHRKLIKTTQVWRVVTSDVSVKFFLTERAGSGAGILDEIPATFTLYNDAILVNDSILSTPTRCTHSSEIKMPMQQHSSSRPPLSPPTAAGSSIGDTAQLGGGGSMFFLLGAFATPVACALSLGQSPTKGVGSRCTSSDAHRGIGHCIAVQDGAGRMLMVYFFLLLNRSVSYQYTYVEVFRFTSAPWIFVCSVKWLELLRRYEPKTRHTVTNGFETYGNLLQSPLAAMMTLIRVSMFACC